MEFYLHKLTTLIPVTITFMLTTYIFVFCTLVSIANFFIKDLEYNQMFCMSSIWSLQFYLYPTITMDYSLVSFEAHWTKDAVKTEEQRKIAIV